MKVVNVQLGFLDKVDAVIIAEKLPILLDNNPSKKTGTCEVFRDNSGRCLGKLELDDDVDENLYFYYHSLNSDDNSGYWFSGLSLATKLYREHPANTLKQMIIV